MPSVDSTGKRLNGSQQKRKAAENKLRQALVKGTPAEPTVSLPTEPEYEELPIPIDFLHVVKPPIDQGVGPVEAWAADINLRAAVAAEFTDELEAHRVVSVIAICAAMGKLRTRAIASADILELRQVRLFVDGNILVERPPFDDPVAVPVWAFLKLATLAYDAAKAKGWMPNGRHNVIVKALTVSAHLPCLAKHEAIADAIEKEG